MEFHVSVQTALIALVSGLLTLILGEAFKRWRTKSQVRADNAATEKIEAEADARTMEAINAAFKTITDRQAADLADVRERLGRVESMLMAERARGDSLRVQVDTLTTENEQLHADLERVRGERDRSVEHCALLEGEIRQLKQVSASAARVYGQDGLEETEL